MTDIDLHGDALSLEGIHKRYGAFQALSDIQLNIEAGELVALLGPSGSGKTTLLRIIAGLEQADRGRLKFGPRDAADLSVQARRVGFVFQHYALFKHMKVADNIGFGLKVRPRGERPDTASIRARVERLLDLVQLPGLGDRYPSQLSGGQRQRVALARALAIEPRVLLLDEPFGALDARVRKDLRRWLRELHQQTGVTTVFVTHDQDEALELADRVVVMRDGRIEQVDTPEQAYGRPATPFVFEFLGDAVKLSAEARDGQIVLDGVRLGPAASPRVGTVELHLRPNAVSLLDVPADDAVPVDVLASQSTGARHRLRLRLAQSGQQLDVEVDATRSRAANGARLHLRCAQWQVF
ncbi:sulfate/molybdate ABC transporter ATP-binding protein [Aquimonas sp.]|jgi:sulfate transport system ATP-binding protein|uniref:sulfate/molybdate ABC transporter ATP-binding protein n=1 Tax=Aquimonas sp. TaxID=1872588 RepID=UPI0037BFC15E